MPQPWELDWQAPKEPAYAGATVDQSAALDAADRSGRPFEVTVDNGTMSNNAIDGAPVQPQRMPWELPWGEITPEPPVKGPDATDYLKSGAAGALAGTGAVFQGAGELAARGVNAVADTDLRAVNPFQGAIDWLNNSQSAGAKKAIAGTDISGEVLSPETWSLGKNPTFSGLALQGINAIGQFAPNLGVALATAGASIPTQLAVGATIGGLQALGGASEEERNKFSAMSDEQLTASSDLYRELIARGVAPAVAKSAVAEAAALGGGIGNAIPSAAEGAFEDFLVGALTRGRWKIPSLGAGFAGRMAAGAAGGAAMGGTEEAIEQAG